MLSRGTKILLFSLLALQVAPISCLEDDSSSSKGTIHLRQSRAVSSLTSYESESSVHTFSSLIDSIISRLLDSKLGSFIAEAIFNTPKFVTDVNTILGKDVLILKGSKLRISFANLTLVIKQQILNVLEKDLKVQGLLLHMVGGFTGKLVDDFGRNIEPEVAKAEFTVSTKTTNLQETSQSSVQNVLRRLILDMVIIMVKPFGPRMNQTLLNITNELLSLYKPVLPNNYFQSILACGINQSVLKGIEVIETVREMLNGLLKSSTHVEKRSLDVSGRKNLRQTRSLIGLIVNPIRFLITIILTPVHIMLKWTMNYIFTNLRPVIGKIILSPIEAIVNAIINLIPCRNC